MLKCLCKIVEIRESAATTESARSLEVFFFTVGAAHLIDKALTLYM